jgi:phage tail-like protein
MNRAEIERLLPGNYRRAAVPDRPLDALLNLMERLHEPSEQVLARLDSYFDPHRTPDRFVPYVARWVDLGPLLDALVQVGEHGPDFPTGVGRLRELILLSAIFWKWRGTRRGLLAFLSAATGDDRTTIVEQPDGRAFHLRFQIPKALERQRPLIEQIVRLEKPAYVTYELTFS